MKKAIVLLLLCLVTVTGHSQIVHYTRTGAKYHSAGCQYLRRSDFTCSLEEALSRGLGPCSRCSPPTKIEKSYKATKPAQRKKPLRKKIGFLGNVPKELIQRPIVLA